MPGPKPIDPGHKAARSVFRVLGPLLIVVGAILIVVAFVDFFSKFGSFDAPTKFWYFFVAMPVLAVGFALTKLGYMGRVARYVSQELTPVGTDTFNYAANQTKDGLRDVAGAIGEGLRGTGGTTEVQVRCHKCNHENDADAKFCSDCGAPLAKTVACPDCNELNDPDARFCDNCGRAL